MEQRQRELEVIEIKVKVRRDPAQRGDEMNILFEDLNGGPLLRDTVVLPGEQPDEMIVITFAGFREKMVRGKLTYFGYWPIEN